MTSSFPVIQSPSSIKFQEPEVYTLDNGLSLYGFNGAGKDIIKVSLVFDTGRWTENTKLSAAFCSNLLKSGNGQLSAYELEEKIDFLGSTIKSSSGYNSFSISLYCLTRELANCLPILVSLLNDTIFPESELKHSKARRVSSLKVNQLKNDYVGDILFKELLFGKEHPYGYSTTEELIVQTTRADILDFYENQFSTDSCAISIAGKFDKNEVDLLNRYLGNNKNWKKSPPKTTKEWAIKTSNERQKTVSIPNSVQGSINIGNLTINRDHSDTYALSLLNMIYGGYFGSRLMSNIREDKGLTYGIYSYIQRYKHASAFIINTDTATENIETCLKEIYFEMTRLKEELIPEEELLKARNYYLGRMLDQADGSFKSESTFMSLRNHDLSLDYLYGMVLAIKSIDSEKLLTTAQTYFSPENMFEVIVK